MMLIHERIAELWVKSKQQLLSESENDEMILCMNANATYAYKMSKLNNLSLLAYMTEDWDWMHKICADIDHLEGQYVMKTEKKSDAS